MMLTPEKNVGDDYEDSDDDFVQDDEDDGSDGEGSWEQPAPSFLDRPGSSRPGSSRPQSAVLPAGRPTSAPNQNQQNSIVESRERKVFESSTIQRLAETRAPSLEGEKANTAAIGLRNSIDGTNSTSPSASYTSESGTHASSKIQSAEPRAAARELSSPHEPKVAAVQVPSPPSTVSFEAAWPSTPRPFYATTSKEQEGGDEKGGACCGLEASGSSGRGGGCKSSACDVFVGGREAIRNRLAGAYGGRAVWPYVHRTSATQGTLPRPLLPTGGGPSGGACVAFGGGGAGGMLAGGAEDEGGGGSGGGRKGRLVLETAASERETFEVEKLWRASQAARAKVAEAWRLKRRELERLCGHALRAVESAHDLQDAQERAALRRQVVRGERTLRFSPAVLDLIAKEAAATHAVKRRQRPAISLGGGALHVFEEKKSPLHHPHHHRWGEGGGEGAATSAAAAATRAAGNGDDSKVLVVVTSMAAAAKARRFEGDRMRAARALKAARASVDHKVQDAGMGARWDTLGETLKARRHTATEVIHKRAASELDELVAARDECLAELDMHVGNAELVLRHSCAMDRNLKEARTALGPAGAFTAMAKHRSCSALENVASHFGQAMAAAQRFPLVRFSGGGGHDYGGVGDREETRGGGGGGEPLVRTAKGVPDAKKKKQKKRMKAQLMRLDTAQAAAAADTAEVAEVYGVEDSNERWRRGVAEVDQLLTEVLCRGSSAVAAASRRRRGGNKGVDDGGGGGGGGSGGGGGVSPAQANQVIPPLSLSSSLRSLPAAATTTTTATPPPPATTSTTIALAATPAAATPMGAGAVRGGGGGVVDGEGGLGEGGSEAAAAVGYRGVVGLLRRSSLVAAGAEVTTSCAGKEDHEHHSSRISSSSSNDRGDGGGDSRGYPLGETTEAAAQAAPTTVDVINKDGVRHPLQASASLPLPSTAMPTTTSLAGDGGGGEDNDDDFVGPKERLRRSTSDTPTLLAAHAPRDLEAAEGKGRAFSRSSSMSSSFSSAHPLLSLPSSFSLGLGGGGADGGGGDSGGGGGRNSPQLQQTKGEKTRSSFDGSSSGGGLGCDPGFGGGCEGGKSPPHPRPSSAPGALRQFRAEDGSGGVFGRHCDEEEFEDGVEDGEGHYDGRCNDGHDGHGTRMVGTVGRTRPHQRSGLGRPRPYSAAAAAASRGGGGGNGNRPPRHTQNGGANGGTNGGGGRQHRPSPWSSSERTTAAAGKVASAVAVGGGGLVRKAVGGVPLMVRHACMWCHAHPDPVPTRAFVGLPRGNGTAASNQARGKLGKPLGRFCSWGCAKAWNRRHSPTMLRHSRDHAVDASAGVFVHPSCLPEGGRQNRTVA